ncbi:hypothetical protein NDU88_002702 [Pleurodeles waltl]|uniref:Uncharacterized protein n=1 Tax=Pleurodeles waltl TaxID=8319 RepID=A0AAV7RCT3_PLEWA|nr:hypothetical protein NDU88_002702 [Pleurodeles waltl]
MQQPNSHSPQAQESEGRMIPSLAGHVGQPLRGVLHLPVALREELCTWTGTVKEHHCRYRRWTSVGGPLHHPRGTTKQSSTTGGGGRWPQCEPTPTPTGHQLAPLGEQSAEGPPGVDPLAPCSNEVVLRSRGPQEEIEAALRLHDRARILGRGQRLDAWDRSGATGKEKAETYRPAAGK